jgi:HAD superfamily hydrolase (TIGR01509 family)
MQRALIFDCDGVLADTEQYGHLPAFNQMWRELGVPWHWSVEEYGRKLKIGGGKERMGSLFQEELFVAKYMPPTDEEERAKLIAEWHKRKSAIYKDIVNSGRIPPRPGVRRLAEEAISQGWTLAVASTSAQESVEAVLNSVMGAETAGRFALVLAGDVVKGKKPAPDIYLLAAERLGIAPCNCIVVEDSNNGLLAAVAAGMRCIVTMSGYTRNEDFSSAEIVLSCLGDPGDERCQVFANRSAARPGSCFTELDLSTILAVERPIPNSIQQCACPG